MSSGSREAAVAAAMHRINQAWLSGRLDELARLVHTDIVMVFPGFTDRSRGRGSFIAGFREFRESATIHEFTEQDARNHVAGNVGVATFRYVMVYEHSGARYRATGRDVWVFEQVAGEWLAVWRTMLDLDETAL